MFLRRSEKQSFALILKNFLDGLTEKVQRGFTGWKFDSETNATCTGNSMMQAGFCMSDPEECLAYCALCAKELYFDPTDDPRDAGNHRHGCPIATFGGEFDKWTISQLYEAYMWQKTLERLEDACKDYVDEFFNSIDETRKRINDLSIKAERLGHA